MTTLEAEAQRLVAVADWTQIEPNLPDGLIDRVMTPALVVDLDRVEHNVRTVLDLAGDPARWRPHLKTTKLPEVWSLQLDAGIRRFKCATTREAAVMLELLDERDIAGGDLLIAYPLLGPARERAAALQTAHPRSTLSILVESPDAAANAPSNLGLFVDVNGDMDRTGIPIDDVETIVATARAAGDRYRGVHCYEGHLRLIDVETRAQQATDLFARVAALCTALREAGVEPQQLITTGTPTFPQALADEALASIGVDHQISAGTVVFSDLNTAERLPSVELLPAATVLSRVVSRPRHGMVTCDAGSKAITVDSGHPCAIALGHGELTPQPPTEEHMPMAVSGEAPEVGTPIHLVPRHVCPTVNLADDAILVRGGAFVGCVPIAARGHETIV